LGSYTDVNEDSSSGMLVKTRLLGC